MKVDLAVVGGGSGGYIAARRAVQLGMRVAVVECRHLGGVCLNRGCVPTKTMLQAVSIANQIRRAATYGVIVSGAPGIDYEALLHKRDEVVQRLRGGLGELLELAGVPVIPGHASFVGPNTLAISPVTVVSGLSCSSGPTVEQVEADHIILATGSKPASLPAPGAEHPRVIDSDGLLALRAVPSSLVVVGAGAIGCEWSFIFAGLGCKVTLVTRRSHVLPREDPDIAAVLAESLIARGVTILTDTCVASITGSEDAVKVEFDGGRRPAVTAEYVLAATGRLPLIDGLNLGSAGVETEGPGWVKTDEYLRTSVASVLAIGDVTGKCLLAHAAFHHAIVAVEKLAGLSPKAACVDYIPYVVYTEPEVASVGLSEVRARERGLPITVGRFPNFANARAVTQGQEAGFVKVVADPVTGKVLGVHMVGSEAGELIAEGVSAIEKGSTLGELAEVIRPHPTLSESLGEACLTAAGRPLFSC